MPSASSQSAKSRLIASHHQTGDDDPAWGWFRRAWRWSHFKFLLSTFRHPPLPGYNDRRWVITTGWPVARDGTGWSWIVWRWMTSCPHRSFTQHNRDDRIRTHWMASKDARKIRQDGLIDSLKLQRTSNSQGCPMARRSQEDLPTLRMMFESRVHDVYTVLSQTDDDPISGTNRLQMWVMSE